MPLVSNIFKICYLEKDCSYKRAIEALKAIEKGEFSFVMSNYIIPFYEELTKNNFDICECYIQILSMAPFFNTNLTIIEQLKRVLEYNIRYKEKKSGENKLSFDVERYLNYDLESEKAINEYQFETILCNKYNIYCVYEILLLIFMNKKDIIDICTEFGLSEIQINIIRAILVKHYYIKEDYDKGDELLNEIRKSKDKPEELKALLPLMQKSKKFYKSQTTIYHF